MGRPFIKNNMYKGVINMNNDKLYQIVILWPGTNEETTIICPYEMIISIIKNLPLMAIERIKIIPNEDLL